MNVQATGEAPSALKREHPALQKMKFINFFLFLWVYFALLDPGPGTSLNLDPIRIHNTVFQHIRKLYLDKIL
jgi:hypothetical protein